MKTNQPLATMKAPPKDIPLQVKDHLLELSARIPEAARSEFIQNTATRLNELTHTYENTLVYAAVGWVVGEIFDHLLVVPIAGWSLTGDNASQIGALIAALLGFAKDRKKAKKLKEEQERVLTIIREELQASLNFKPSH